MLPARQVVEGARAGGVDEVWHARVGESGSGRRCRGVVQPAGRVVCARVCVVVIDVGREGAG